MRLHVVGLTLLVANPGGALQRRCQFRRRALDVGAGAEPRTGLAPPSSMRWVLLFAWLGIGCGSGPVTNADGNTRCFEPLDTYCSKATTCVTSYSDDRTTARRACAREPTVVHVTIGHCLGWRIATIRLRGGDTFTSLFTALGQLYAVLEGTDCIAGPDGITLLAACEPPDFEIDCDAVDAGM